MTRRRTPYLPALIVASVLMACVAAVLAASKEAGSNFPGKNGKIAFASTRDGKTGGEDIYAMSPSGTAVERLTAHPQGDVEPAWSPDGSRIAFTSDRDGNPSAVEASQDPRSDYEIYTMDADGTAVERLTDNSRGDFNPDW